METRQRTSNTTMAQPARASGSATPRRSSQQGTRSATRRLIAQIMDSNTRGSNEAQEGEESRQESDDGIDEYQQTDDSTEGTDEPSSQDEEESDDEDIAPMMPSSEVNPGAAFRWILE